MPTGAYFDRSVPPPQARQFIEQEGGSLYESSPDGRAAVFKLGSGVWARVDKQLLGRVRLRLYRGETCPCEVK